MLYKSCFSIMSDRFNPDVKLTLRDDLKNFFSSATRYNGRCHMGNLLQLANRTYTYVSLLALPPNSTAFPILIFSFMISNVTPCVCLSVCCMVEKHCPIRAILGFFHLWFLRYLFDQLDSRHLSIDIDIHLLGSWGQTHPMTRLLLAFVNKQSWKSESSRIFLSVDTTMKWSSNFCLLSHNKHPPPFVMCAPFPAGRLFTLSLKCKKENLHSLRPKILWDLKVFENKDYFKLKILWD